jgi:tetratricopeptide (TPR) repeat protein
VTAVRRLARLARVLAAALVLGALSAPARAADTEVQRHAAALVAARGPTAYVLLRRIWNRWDQGDPDAVEGSLAAAAADDRLEPAVRVYAGLLAAYARRLRGDLDGARHRIAGLGFVSDWLVVGPFANDNRTGLAEASQPERELAEPVLLDRSFDGKERPVRWRPTPAVFPWGWVALGDMVRPNRDVCVLATTFLRGRARPLGLWVGTTGAFRLWIDDALVLEDTAYRELDADRHTTSMRLEATFRRLTLKVCADESPPAFALRLAEPNGAPALDVETHATVEASTEAASTLRARARKRGPSERAKALGALARFEARLGAEPLDPGAMEELARYLVLTGGEDAGSHRARDLASRAAASAPTVERLLLAAGLAEDRNGRRDSVERAAALARSREERIAVLVARAQLARSGPSWREAASLYDQVLALDPTHVEATLGKVDVYVEAGLPRTALGALESALGAMPTTVALLRAYAGQLRAVGRDLEAAEVEARYAAVRFDDPGYLKDRIELAVARRDEAEVRRRVARLLAAEPSSIWANGVAARALAAVGDVEGAMARWRAALDIAPEDVTALRALGDLHGERGERDAQVALLERILRIVPQAQPVRAYLDHVRPAGVRDDERWAAPPERFLARRGQADTVHGRRTLRRLSVTTVLPNGLAHRFKQLVFQPLTEEAAQSGREHVFAYHADRQIVQLRAARVFRADGRVEESSETTESPLHDPSIHMYTLQRLYHVRLPRLGPGDVVELRYRIDDVAPRNELSDYFGDIDMVQDDEPILDLEHVLVVPRERSVRLWSSPLAGLRREDREDEGRRIHRFTATDVPALEGEAQMPPWSEVLAHVHASTFSSWKDVGAFYFDLARDKLDVDDEVRRRVRALTSGLASERDKVAAVYRYAATETRYVALEFGVEGIRPRRAALTLARGWGDCKDKATLIVAMLREIGIAAEIVLVRTRLRGDVDTTVASLEPFDHAIVYVPSLDLYLDGTAEATGTAELPAMDRGAVALRVTSEGGKLVRLPEPPPDASVEAREIDLELAEGGKLSVRARLRAHGVTAPAWRTRYLAEATRRERVLAELAPELGVIELADGAGAVRVGDLEAHERPVSIEASGRARAKREGDAWAVPVGPNLRLLPQFAAKATRTHAVVVGPARERRERWSVALGRGARVLSAPSPLKVESPFGSFEREIRSEPGRLVVETRLVLRAARVGLAEYDAWRRFCQSVDAAAEPRVLVTGGR